MVAVFRAGDADPKEVFVHHNAGLAGYGGSSYIDSVILRDRDTSAAWHEEIEESLRDERVYYAQNWRGDVSALLTDTGSMIEWVKYSAYGVPYSLPAGDTDSNGSWDAADEGRIGAAMGVYYDVRYDTDLDGELSDSDIGHANSIAGGYQTLGRGVQSSPAVANRVGYAGYRYDPTFKGASRTIYHVRHRVYDADVGRWTRRDPLGYVDGMSLYEYVRSRPVIGVDPTGTDTAIGAGRSEHGSAAVIVPAIPAPLAPVVCTPVGAAVVCCVVVGAIVVCNYDTIVDNTADRIVRITRPRERFRCSKQHREQLHKIQVRECRGARKCDNIYRPTCDDVIAMKNRNRNCARARENVRRCFTSRRQDAEHKRLIDEHHQQANWCHHIATVSGCYGTVAGD